jgi:hypothetical protein
MASVAARGPVTLLLQSSAGQYIFLGLGVYALFPEQVQRLLGPLAAQNLLTQFGGGTSTGTGTTDSQNNRPIIIQTPGPTVHHMTTHRDGKGSLISVVTYAVVGAGACWAGYVVCVHILPDAVTELLPVTKRLFEKTTQTLGKGILNVKQVLEEKILGLSKQQDDLSRKQDDTHRTVNGIERELGEARVDLIGLKSSLDRCEGSLDNTQDMQGYTLKGIKLLVRCVTSFMPNDPNYIDDIARFIEEGDLQDFDSAHPKNKMSTTTQGSKGGRPGYSNTVTPARQTSIGPKNSSTTASSMVKHEIPSITGVPSDDDDQSTNTVGSFNESSFNDIRALLGH